MDAAAALSCLLEILDGKVFSIPELLTEISQYECCSLRAALVQFQDSENLQQFLQNNGGHFTVENGRVVAHDGELETFRQLAVNYFKDAMEKYTEPRRFMNIRGHLRQADQHIKNFINTFYPGKEFKNFLLNHPDIFTVYNDGTVFLIEKECVNYFANYVEEGGTHFESLHGHLGQAPRHVIDYINTYYPFKNFLQFFQNNCDTFYTHGLYVFLNNDDVEDIF